LRLKEVHLVPAATEHNGPTHPANNRTFPKSVFGITMEDVVGEDSGAQTHLSCSESGNRSRKLGRAALGEGSQLESAAFRRVFGNRLFEVGRKN
jgi:hypothetical protein